MSKNGLKFDFKLFNQIGKQAFVMKPNRSLKKIEIKFLQVFVWFQKISEFN